jgi:hypothetical protein
MGIISELRAAIEIANGWHCFDLPFQFFSRIKSPYYGAYRSVSTSIFGFHFAIPVKYFCKVACSIRLKDAFIETIR